MLLPIQFPTSNYRDTIAINWVGCHHPKWVVDGGSGYWRLIDKKDPRQSDGGHRTRLNGNVSQQSQTPCPTNGIRPSVDAQFAVDVLDVESNRVCGDTEFLSDLSARQVRGQKPQHLQLALAERLDECKRRARSWRARRLLRFALLDSLLVQRSH